MPSSRLGCPLSLKTPNMGIIGYRGVGSVSGRMRRVKTRPEYCIVPRAASLPRFRLATT